MVTAKSLGTGATPLKLSREITAIANEAWSNGAFLEKVSTTTGDLLRFWDPNGSFSDLRNFNFHKGQWQAILNTIYVHDILKIKNVHDMYMSVDPELLQEMDLLDLKKSKYSHKDYCIKMATGTGKTWVMHALLIWQYLNSKHEEEPSGMFSKNFLLVAPGLIVYERLLDAYLGKIGDNGARNFEESDFKKFEDLFIPPAYKEEIFGFVQSCAAQKDEIGRKVTGEGLIAITNWHLLVGEEEDEEFGTPLDRPRKIIKELRPITPGTTAGHSLEELDNQYFRRKELVYLANLPDLVVFNDEAHHLGEWKTFEEVLDKKWQKALDEISEKKKDKFVQIDFSATPYIVTGSGQKRARHFFPHIITNFELTEAVKLGLVKTIAIDKRKELAALPLEFKAEREGKTVSLSEGQRLMLRAGLTKLKILEQGFLSIDKSKYPKMLVVCEDTSVVPFVTQFILQEGWSQSDVVEIHSKKNGDILEQDKLKLSNLDKNESPKVIVSVLMLREGFDVNSICVIVPLRSSSSYTLLEQTIGRGLRLMWREPEYEDIKRENRERLLIKKEEPKNYMDILSIIEHPRFIEFYNNEFGDAFGILKELPKKEHVVGDIVKIGLKENYKDYDMFWPLIVQDREEMLISKELKLENLEIFPISLEQLKPIISREGELFYGEEITVKTKFGEYSVKPDIFDAQSYNSFISKIVNAVSQVPVKLERKKQKNFYIMQINTAQVARLTDDYIRHRLFGKDFDPMKDNNWKILLLTEAKIIQHIIKNLSQKIYDLQNNIDVTEAKIIKRFFSEVFELKIRESCSIDVAKTIYSKIAFPSNKGGFEKNFIEFIDSDSKLKSFIKINEHYHDFANVLYIREDGMLAHYFPDFILKVNNKIYLVETKADRDLNNENVLQKRRATLEWIEKINKLKSEDRMNCDWFYVLLGENTFYSMSEKGATTEEILEYAKMNKGKIEGKITGFVNKNFD